MLKENDRLFSGKKIRVVDAEGTQLGVIGFEEGIAKAKQAGLDLVLVADKSDPPVCRLMDFGRLLYEQKRKVKDQRRNQHAHKVKEVKFRLNIDPHDYGIKLNHAVEFLDKGHKVKVTIMFKGRELAHKEIGYELVERITTDLDGQGSTDEKAKLLGRNISISFTPTKGAKH